MVHSSDDSAAVVPRGRDADGSSAPDQADRWPWACLCCGSVLYHDVECCRDCGPSPWSEEGSGEPERLLPWIRRQTVPTLVLKVAAVVGIELALTVLWIRTVVPAQ